MSRDDSSLSLRAQVRETVFRPFPLASPSGALYIERMFFLRRCINQPIHYLRLYRSIYSNIFFSQEIRPPVKAPEPYGLGSHNFIGPGRSNDKPTDPRTP